MIRRRGRHRRLQNGPASPAPGRRPTCRVQPLWSRRPSIPGRQSTSQAPRNSAAAGPCRTSAKCAPGAEVGSRREAQATTRGWTLQAQPWTPGRSIRQRHLRPLPARMLLSGGPCGCGEYPCAPRGQPRSSGAGRRLRRQAGFALRDNVLIGYPAFSQGPCRCRRDPLGIRAATSANRHYTQGGPHSTRVAFFVFGAAQGFQVS